MKCKKKKPAHIIRFVFIKRLRKLSEASNLLDGCYFGHNNDGNDKENSDSDDVQSMPNASTPISTASTPSSSYDDAPSTAVSDAPPPEPVGQSSDTT